MASPSDCLKIAILQSGLFFGFAVRATEPNGNLTSAADQKEISRIIRQAHSNICESLFNLKRLISAIPAAQKLPITLAPRPPIANAAEFATEIRAFNQHPKNSHPIAAISDQRMLEDLVYVRHLSSLNPYPSKFLTNTKAAEVLTKTWVNEWLADDQPVAQIEWRKHLRLRHLAGSGVSAGTPHSREDYTSDEESLYPGEFRFEHLSNPGVPINYCYDCREHVVRSLEFFGERMPSRRIEVLGSSGLEAPLTILGASEFANFAPDKAQEDYLEAAWNCLVRLRPLLKRYRDLSKPTDSPKATIDLNQIRGEALNLVADYFHTANYGHWFFKTNLSILMPEINTYLTLLDFRPVAHGWLDLVALRMDYRPFRRYFTEYVQAMGRTE